MCWCFWWNFTSWQPKAKLLRQVQRLFLGKKWHIVVTLWGKFLWIHHICTVGSSVSPTYSMIPKLSTFLSKLQQNLAKSSFGWSQTHLPHNFEQKKHWLQSYKQWKYMYRIWLQQCVDWLIGWNLWWRNSDRRICWCCECIYMGEDSRVIIEEFDWCHSWIYMCEESCLHINFHSVLWVKQMGTLVIHEAELTTKSLLPNFAWSSSLNKLEAV